uniref:Uncharacterized protein n=1 Tax=Oryza brachyantha TaxID=4533 RepID=J3NDB7_ORYBR
MSNVSTTKEFEPLALDGHNFPTWSMDLKVNLSLREFYEAIIPPRGTSAPDNKHKYNALYMIRAHIHKSEYLTEEDPHVLWNALQKRYEQQKAIVLPKALHEWNHLRLQDFKSVGEYNHAIHKICAKLKFCEKEPSDADKIENTLSTMMPAGRILHQQYRERNFHVYSELINTLLQAERHNEILVWNSNKRPFGAAPLPEVHTNTQTTNNKNGESKPPFKKFKAKGKGKGKGENKRKREHKPHYSHKGKNIPNKDIDKSKLCQKCGCYSHITKKCRTPRHLVNLYLKSVGRDHPNQGQKYEDHFNFQKDVTMEDVAPYNFPNDIDMTNASCSKTVPIEPSNNETQLPEKKLMDTDKMLVEFTSTDMFGDLN